jgi:hypothetical protein
MSLDSLTDERSLPVWTAHGVHRSYQRDRVALTVRFRRIELLD